MLELSQWHPRLQLVIVSNATGEVFEIHEHTPDGNDVTPHQDVLQFSTHKDMAEIAGTFSVKLTGRRDSKGRLWSDLIQPMDYVELHARRTWDPDPQATTLIMRGFVDVSTAAIGSGADGSPDIYCLIEGRDYGKLLLRQLWFLYPGLNFPTSGDNLGQAGQLLALLNEFGFEQAMNIPPKEFLTKIIRRIVGDDAPGGAHTGIAQLPAGAPDLAVLVGHSLEKWRVLNPLLAPLTGSVYNLLHYYESKPFWELFVTDSAPPDTGEATSPSANGNPVVIWRRSPYKDFNGKVAAQLPENGGDEDPEGEIDPNRGVSIVNEIISMHLSYSDEQAYSYFVCIPNTPTATDDASTWMIFQPLQPDGAAIWHKEITQRFGFLPLEAQITLWPFGSNRDSNQESANTAQEQSFLGIASTYSNWLSAVYAENYMYQSGTLIVQGNSDYRIGSHLKIQEDGREFYIEGVDHSFTVDPIDFRTTLGVTRGRWPADTAPFLPIPRTGLTIGIPGVNPAPPPSSTPDPTNPVINPSANPSPCNWADPTGGTRQCTQAYGETALEHPHAGIDLAIPTGTQLVAPTSGVVEVHDLGMPNIENDQGHYGNYIILHTDDGHDIMLGHMTTGSFQVLNGQRVEIGQPLGKSGSSGYSTGPHLHLEVRISGSGVTVNPSGCFPAYLGVCPDLKGHNV